MTTTPSTQLTKVVQALRRATLAKDGAGLSDGQLLNLFIEQRDDAAFAALVHRHGPLVWGVCRRVLAHHQDAEDAFQATFLVLARKAASVRTGAMVPSWLHSVALRTAVRARVSAGKRHLRERQVSHMPEPEAWPQESWHDLEPVLDRELLRLPEKYRTAILLCDLEGKTGKDAARQLRIPEGTLASRLRTARMKLARGLARHGVTLTAGALAAALSHNAASAGAPAAAMSSVIKGVALIATGQSLAAGTISAKVAALSKGVIKAMLLTKLKTMMALVLLLSMVTFTGVMVLAWGQTGPATTRGKGNSVEKPGAKALPRHVPLPPQPKPEAPPKDFTNSIGMKFVWIPAGSFVMGSPKEEKERKDGEVQHKVMLTKGFYMGVYTVTQEQWQEVMGNNPSFFKGEKNLPVEQVSWDDCQEFCKKLRDKDKKPYRLPSEAEWEYACRAGTTTPFHFGNTISTDQANYNGEVYGNGKKGVYREKTTPVGSFPANAWGLYDMHGNVFNWCQDWYDDYPRKDVVDPQGPEKVQELRRVFEGPGRVLRGGPWSYGPRFCRSASRNGGLAGFRYVQAGLRVCFFLEQEAKPKGNPRDAEGAKEQPLTVTIKPQKDRIRVHENFTVDLRVVNSSKTPQSFRVMSRSWYDNWNSSNERVTWKRLQGMDDLKTEVVKLAPGEAYEKTLPMLLPDGKPREKVSFKMSFTPIGINQTTYWSNEVTLQVDTEKLYKELDDLLSKEGEAFAPPVPGMTAKLLKCVQSEDRSVRDKAITLLDHRVYGRAIGMGTMPEWVGMRGREGTIDPESYQALRGLLERVNQLEDRLGKLEKAGH